MRNLFLLCLLFQLLAANAQQPVDTIAENPKHTKFNYKPLIIPAALISYGVVAIGNDQLLDFNHQIQSEVKEDIDEKITIDDFSQYVPMVSVYGLNALGIEGKHNLKDRTIIMATSYLIMSSTVLALKSAIKTERPDGSSKNSFPSGHTATAFAGAEFLWQEYKDVSPWYGVAGFAVATGTGVFRMYNNRHWLNDVAAGAGIGIFSTKIAYWINPYVKDKIFGSKDKKVSSTMAPFYNGKQMGCGLVVVF
ncbi:MAG TPA: phosphatase PAP2 family protein [Flavobacterium sp.]|nr:phosphatase PAP2 family protein [Flavobacterium sp.]